jgi:hypothetical protein
MKDVVSRNPEKHFFLLGKNFPGEKCCEPSESQQAVNQILLFADSPRRFIVNI